MGKPTICAVILAAGSSSRMGTDKQLLKLNGQYMLEIVVMSVLHHSFEKIIVIIGHHGKKIRDQIQIEDNRLEWVNNSKYEHGQSTSFLTGVYASQQGGYDNIMFFLGDQPFIKKETISQVLEAGGQCHEHKADSFVIRPYFEKCPGHPVYLGNMSGLNWSEITGDQGGRGLLKQVSCQEEVHLTDPFITFDIDTEEDYKKALLIAFSC